MKIFCSLNIKGKRTNFLVTPYARKFAKKHYGVARVYGDNSASCPAGIEIDDTRSHLHAKTFHSEAMMTYSTTYDEGPFQRVTDASMAVLQDSGNYKIDFRMVRPLVWGNPESINGKPIPNFIRGVWQIDYPENYYYDPNVGDYTGFDYKHWGNPSSIDAPQCPNSQYQVYCEGKEMFNPKNWKKIGWSDDSDYLYYKFPMYVCPKNKAKLPSNDYWLGCGEYV